ncbi:MAG: ABC transporter ATP-binding protein [Hyphomicrobiales bacterium]|nr:ABC transporter ATP-binding protein [Hyphomicrobiales bacterium]MCP5373990.1 ABC transporter ATP-binding protein [Hyphomicrobiales bacterium]
MADTVFTLTDVTKARHEGGAGFELCVPRLEVPRGARLALVGESGCGKSTLLDLLGLALSPTTAGAFTFSGGGTPADIAAIWQRRDANHLGELRKRHIGYVLQTGALVPYLGVLENIDLTRRLLGLPDDGTSRRLAARLGLAGHLDKDPAALSVGERQRVAIGRALAHRPAVILADEPTASLDPHTATRVMELFMELIDETGATLIVATHDWHQVDRLGLTKVGHALHRDEEHKVTTASFST